MTYDLNKLYRTRDGLKAKIWMDNNGGGVMLGAYLKRGRWYIHVWTLDGKTLDIGEHHLDLVGEWREKIKYSVELWGNEFKFDPNFSLLCEFVFGRNSKHNSKEKSINCPIKYRIDVTEIEGE